MGAQCRDRVVAFTSTFAAFFARASDQVEREREKGGREKGRVTPLVQLRMAAVSFANLKCAGSHVGVSIGEDGPSQMALEVR